MMVKEQKWRQFLYVVALVLSVFASKPVIAAEEPNLELSEEAKAAVDAGVVLIFSGDYALRERWGIFARTLEQHTHRFTLTRHALSNQYIVKVDEIGNPKLFRSVTEAVLYISNRSMTILESYSSPEKPFSMRVALNKYELPAPMRLKAFIADDWDIDTGWIEWTSAN